MKNNLIIRAGKGGKRADKVAKIHTGTSGSFVLIFF